MAASASATDKPEITNLLYATDKKNEPATPIAEMPEEEDIEMLAKLIWGEARGVESITEKAAVAWCVLNRVDAKGYPNSIEAVITQPHQFVGYDEDYPATKEHRLIARRCPFADGTPKRLAKRTSAECCRRNTCTSPATAAETTSQASGAARTHGTGTLHRHTKAEGGTA